MKISAVLKVLWAQVKANAWCLVHPWSHVMTRSYLKPGRWLYEIVEVSVGKGSILDGSWKTSRTFYEAAL